MRWQCITQFLSAKISHKVKQFAIEKMPHYIYTIEFKSRVP